MQIVIAQYTDRPITERFDKLQRLQRLRSAVHQVTTEPELVFSRVEINFLEQATQLRVATLNITNRVNRHRRSS